MTTQDSTATNSPRSPTRRGSASSLSSRSTLSQRSRRSPSPIVSFTPTPLSADTKGVKDITRHVLQTLEGLGHFDFSAMHSKQGGIEEKDEYERTPSPVDSSSSTSHDLTAPLPNGNGHAQPPQPKKIDWEIPRKLLHSSIGFGTLYLWHSQASPNTVIVILWSALCIIAPADFIRLRSRRFAKLYERLLGFLMRESEKSSTNGVIWYILGVNFALTFYPLDVAVVAILILSWADTAASTIGRLWGSKTPRLPQSFMGIPFAPRKSLAGFIAACITGAAVAAGFWTFNAPMRPFPGDITWTWANGVQALADSPIPAEYTFSLTGAIGLTAISLFAGLVSGVAEALDLNSLDDNLTLPIISGGCLFAFFKLLSVFAS